MSFSSDVKKELFSNIPSARHCRIAELYALLSFCGKLIITPKDEYILSFTSEHEMLAEKYAVLLKRIFQIEAQVQVKSDRRRRSSEVYTVILREEEEVRRVLEALRILNKDGVPEENEATLVHQVLLQRNCCRRAFIRGAFLAAGSISDPEKSYHFEIVCQDSSFAEQIAELMIATGIEARCVARKKYMVVYVKDSSLISDLLGMMEATVSLLTFENVRVMHEVRGNVSRKVNCETANINKTANAAAKQINDIEFIEKKTGFAKLSNGLDEMARVRLQYPTATLQELGKLLDPPVGKSGVNHRLRKLSEIADQLREAEGGI
ncbi:MAG: DNA-binding protein WhiA [Eubacterium sp.]|nr:DNA-binding protein WhiA [Eubacterium sp.]